MHKNGVIHRDLNPTNVFLLEEETNLVKILDFNVSKLVETSRSSRLSFDDEEEAKD